MTTPPPNSPTGAGPSPPWCDCGCGGDPVLKKRIAVEREAKGLPPNASALEWGHLAVEAAKIVEGTTNKPHKANQGSTEVERKMSIGDICDRGTEA